MTDVGAILNALGGRGRFQLMQLFLVNIGYFPASYQLLNIVFVGRSLEHHCRDVRDDETQLLDRIIGKNVTYGACSITTVFDNNSQSRSCSSGYVYADSARVSVVSDLDLVCERSSLTDLTQMLLIGGQAFGALTLPHASDRFGRKLVFILSNFALLFIGIGIALSPNYATFAILRFIIGAFQQGIVTTVTTLSIEVFPSQHRKLVGFVTNMAWGVGTMTIPIWAYFLQHYSWRVLQLAYTSVSLYALVQYWLVEESIPWLVANGRTNQVVQVLKKAARISRVDVHDVMEPLHLLQDEQQQHDTKVKQEDTVNQLKEDDALLETSLPVGTELQADDEKEGSHDDLHHEIARVKQYTIFDMLKSKRLLMYSCVLWFTWLTNALTYFGLFLTSSSLAGDQFLNFFLNAGVEVPACILFYVIIDRIGRKKTCMVFHGVAGVALIIATILRTSDGRIATDISTVFSLIGKFGISGSFGTMFLYTPEIFPTNMRNVGLGTCSAFARIGGMMSPFSNLLASYASWAPGTIFGVCCLIVTFLVTFLPESTGRELPQTIEDLTNWHKTDSVTYVPADDDSFTDMQQNDVNMKHTPHNDVNIDVLHDEDMQQNDVNMKHTPHNDVNIDVLHDEDVGVLQDDDSITCLNPTKK